MNSCRYSAISKSSYYIIILVLILHINTTNSMIKDGKSLVSWRQWSKSNQAPTSTPTMIWTREQVSAHNILNDFWCILQGKVYNLTPFLEYHPGGNSVIIITCLSNHFDRYQDLETICRQGCDYHV